MLSHRFLLGALLVLGALLLTCVTSSATMAKPMSSSSKEAPKAPSSKLTSIGLPSNLAADRKTISHSNDSTPNVTEKPAAMEQPINGSNTTKLADGNAQNQTVVAARNQTSAQNQTAEGVKVPDINIPSAQNKDVEAKGPDSGEPSDQIDGDVKGKVVDNTALDSTNDAEPDEGDGGGNFPSTSPSPQPIPSLKQKDGESDVALSDSQFAEAEDGKSRCLPFHTI